MNAAPMHPDADLLALGAEFRAAWASYSGHFRAHPNDALLTDEEAEVEDAISERCSDVMDRMLAIEPKTVDGLKVIAMVWGYCNHLPSTGSYENSSEYPSDRAAHSVMGFLLADVGI